MHPIYCAVATVQTAPVRKPCRSLAAAHAKSPVGGSPSDSPCWPDLMRSRASSLGRRNWRYA
jgi:hypothetical protein